MDWDDLRFVLAVTRAGSLARAASALGVTHTTVGRRLSALEARLGVRLFDRTPEGFRPTDAGQDLANAGEQVEAEVYAAEARVLGRDAELRGSVRVSTFDVPFQRYADVFASFVERYPNVELTVTTSLGEVSLTRREADIALRMTNSPPEHLVGRKVDRMAFAVYASERLVARIGADASWADYPWIGWDARLPIAAWFDGWVAEHAPGLRVVLRLDENTLARREAILAGIGAQFMPVFEGDALPGVRRIGPVLAAFDRDVWLLTLRELRHTTRIRAFLAHFEREIRGGEPDRGGSPR